MTNCPFCSAPVDPQAAQAAVEAQEKINRACNGASLIRNLAGVMWVLFFVRLLPFVGCFAGLAVVALFFVVLARLIMWQSRYGGIQTADVDYQQARRNALIALVLWVLMIIVPVVLIVFFAGLSAALSR